MNEFNAFRRRYSCAKCTYTTDRRDLFGRHENIHREEKPFECYVCAKMFNRADHVKKHFLRIHKGVDYDVKRTKRAPIGRPENTQQMLSSNQSISAINSNPLLSQLLEQRNSALVRALEDMSTSGGHSPSLVSPSPASCSVQKREEDFECEYCGCTFVDECSLSTHRYVLHRYLLESPQRVSSQSALTTFQCVICGVRKETQRAIMSHMSQHNNVAKAGGRAEAEGVAPEGGGGSRRKQLSPKRIIRIEDFLSQN